MTKATISSRVNFEKQCYKVKEAPFGEPFLLLFQVLSGKHSAGGKDIFASRGAQGGGDAGGIEPILER